MDLTNSTVTENSAYLGGGIYNRGTTDISSSTITGNSAGAHGGGIFLFADKTLTLDNSIVAENTAVQIGPDIANDNGSTISGTFNLIGDGSGQLSGFVDGVAGNQVGTSGNPIDPLLGPLADNGGPTQTHALLTGSPAIDAGNGSESTDQRGFARPIDLTTIANAIGGNSSDIGAFELQFELPALVGDYNMNGTVDSADYTVWLDSLGAVVTPFTGADGNGDAMIDQLDYDVWKSNFGNIVAVATAAKTSTTEPVSEVSESESPPAETTTATIVPTALVLPEIPTVEEPFAEPIEASSIAISSFPANVLPPFNLFEQSSKQPSNNRLKERVKDRVFHDLSDLLPTLASDMLNSDRTDPAIWTPTSSEPASQSHEDSVDHVFEQLAEDELTAAPGAF